MLGKLRAGTASLGARPAARPAQRDDAALSSLPTCHLFGCASSASCGPAPPCSVRRTKEMACRWIRQGCIISLSGARTASLGARTHRDDMSVDKRGLHHLFRSRDDKGCIISLPAVIATDVAARGIDVADITHVVNFDMPNRSGPANTPTAAPKPSLCCCSSSACLASCCCLGCPPS